MPDLRQLRQELLLSKAAAHPIPHPPLQFLVVAKSPQIQSQRIFETHQSYFVGQLAK